MPDVLTGVETVVDTTGRSYVKFSCPVCAGKIAVSASTQSHVVTCPHCDAVLMVPAVGVGVGAVLGDFELLRLLGQGAMGHVYLAMQASMERRVAVKILAPGMTASALSLNLFLQEIRTLARLQHPNIVTAFAAGQEQDCHYLAMYYVRGETLQHRLNRKGMLSEEEALSVICQVGEALKYAWEQHGIIHRDVKPGNIMIDAGGEIKLMDLGISKCVYEEAAQVGGPRIFGTPHYMSPEQARGEPNLDFRSDQYALGVTFYRMLSGSPPCDEPSMQAVIDHQAHATDALHLKSPVSRRSRRIVERLTAVHPDGRYPSWDDLLSDALAALRVC